MCSSANSFSSLLSFAEAMANRPPWFVEEALELGPCKGACTFGLCPNVWVDLSWDKGVTGPCMYKITNPESVAVQTNLHPHVLEGVSRFSPRSEVTCPWAQRAQIHIPLDAHSFVWAHPIMETRSSSSWLAAENDLICFLAYGGYVYFDKNDEIVKINGIKVGADLCFTGPFALNGNAKRLEAFEAIQSANRLNNVTLTALKGHISKFGWVLPGEFEDCPLGAFVYQYKDSKHNRFIKMEMLDSGFDLAAEDLGIQLEFMYQQTYVASISDNSPLKALEIKRGVGMHFTCILARARVALSRQCILHWACVGGVGASKPVEFTSCFMRFPHMVLFAGVLRHSELAVFFSHAPLLSVSRPLAQRFLQDLPWLFCNCGFLVHAHGNARQFFVDGAWLRSVRTGAHK